MQDPFQACSNPLTLLDCYRRHRTKPCSMYPVRWRNHETGDALGLLWEGRDSAHVHVPFLSWPRWY